MDAIRVAVVNWTLISGDEFSVGISALREQVNQDFAPAWGVDAELVPVPAERNTSAPGFWGLVLLDNNLANDPGDRGEALHHYRTDTTLDGHPLAKVFVHAGTDWTHAASQGLLQMLANPDGAGVVRQPSEASPLRLYAKRVCEPCAAPSDGYLRAGRLVSDFVYPAWFGGGQLGSEARFDHSRHMSGPFEVLQGGSIDFVELESAPTSMLFHRIEPSKLIWPP
jgi:hypothetical protein